MVKMPNFRRPGLPRYYHPFDPLQLGEEVDGSHRANKQSISIPLFRARKRKIIWSPLSYKNLLCFYDREANLKYFMQQMSKKAKKLEESCSIDIYNFDNTIHSKWIRELDDEYKIIKQHPFENTLEFFIQELIKYKNNVKVNTKALNVLESPNRVTYTICLFLTEEHVETIINSKNRDVFFKLLNESVSERINIMIFVKKAKRIPAWFIEKFDLKIFLSNDNFNYAKNHLYPDYYLVRPLSNQKLWGCATINNKKELITIHPYKYTLSERTKQQQKQLNDEHEQYKKYLESLTEGSTQ